MTYDQNEEQPYREPWQPRPHDPAAHRGMQGPPNDALWQQAPYPEQDYWSRRPRQPQQQPWQSYGQHQQPQGYGQESPSRGEPWQESGAWGGPGYGNVPATGSLQYGGVPDRNGHRTTPGNHRVASRQPIRHRRAMLVGGIVAVLLACVGTILALSLPGHSPLSLSPSLTVLPAGTSKGTIYWTIPDQPSPYTVPAGFTESFHGEVAGKKLTGTVVFPAPANANECAGNPGIVFAGTFGTFPFRVTQSCLKPYTAGPAVYTGHIGGLAVHGTYSATDGPPGLGYPESIMQLTGSYDGHNVSIRYAYPDATGGNSGKLYTTMVAITVSS